MPPGASSAPLRRAGWHPEKVVRIMDDDVSVSDDGPGYFIGRSGNPFQSEPDAGVPDAMLVAGGMRQLVRNCRYYISESPSTPFITIGRAIVGAPIDLSTEVPFEVFAALGEDLGKRAMAVLEEFAHYIQVGLSDAISCRNREFAPQVMLDAISEAHSACARELLRVAALCIVEHRRSSHEHWIATQHSPDVFIDPISLEDFALMVGRTKKTLQNQTDRPRRKMEHPNGDRYSYDELRTWYLDRQPDKAHLLPKAYADGMALLRKLNVQPGG